MSNTDPRNFLEGLSSEDREIVLALREVVLRIAPGIEETLLWGGLSYHRPRVGGRVKGAVCQVGVKRGRVHLGFIHGIRLADPAGLLRGEGLSKRHVVIESVADAGRLEIAELIRQAAALDPTQWA
jgi:hypothetical protein